MNVSLTLVVVLVFVALAAWHFWMALTPASGLGGALPVADGKPLFVPSRRATVAVGVLLLCFAALVAATGGLFDAGVPRGALAVMSGTLAIGLLARAIGEFRYLGFFKRVRGSRFATLDTIVYSPLCLLLAVGVAMVAAQHRI